MATIMNNYHPFNPPFSIFLTYMRYNHTFMARITPPLPSFPQSRSLGRTRWLLPVLPHKISPTLSCYKPSIITVPQPHPIHTLPTRKEKEKKKKERGKRKKEIQTSGYSTVRIFPHSTDPAHSRQPLSLAPPHTITHTHHSFIRISQLDPDNGKRMVFPFQATCL